jgi:hypothetical protein
VQKVSRALPTGLIFNQNFTDKFGNIVMQRKFLYSFDYTQNVLCPKFELKLFLGAMSTTKLKNKGLSSMVNIWLAIVAVKGKVNPGVN